MALISFGYRVDMFAIDPPLEVGAYIVAYDLDGVLKQKDHLGVVTLVGSGAGGPQGPPGPVGPTGLTWSGAWVATQSYPLNYAVGYASASWWCISPITGSPSNPGPDVDTTHWALLAAQGSPGSQGGTGSQGLQGSQGPIGINWIGDWIINVYDVRDAVYYNGSSYVCIASTVGTETLSPDTNTACWDIISLKGDVGPQGATGSPGVSGATGSTLQDIFYNIGGTVSATNSTTAIYRTGSINIGTGTASNSRFVVSSSGGINSLVVDESGNIYNGDLTSLKLGYNSLPNLNKYVVNLSYFYDIDNGSGYTDGTYSVTTSLYSGIPLTEYPVIVVDVSGGFAVIQEVLSIGSGWVDDGYSTILTATIPGGSGYQVQIIIYLTDTTNQYNTAIGNNSLYSNKTGAYNTSIGYNSLYSNVDGVYNTSIGYNSLYSNVDGVYNTALGVQSLYSNTTGANNIAISYQSLYSNTTGISNIALGVQSLYSNTTGNYNITVGMYSLHSNTSGYYNTAIGYLSLYSNTIGTYNTAIGSNSLEKNTTTISTLNIIYGGSGYTASITFSSIQLSYISGSTATTYPIVTVYVGTGGTVSTVTLVTNGTGFKDTTTVMGANLGTGVTFSVGISSLSSGNNNTAIGNNSLYSNTSGAYNTAIGNYSLYSNTTGDNNVALGNNSLYSNTTGDNNTAIGINSLYSNTSGHSNIAIGLNVLSNNLIGNNNVGIGNNILVFNTTGIFNTAIGNNALGKNITGSYNIALGYQSGTIISGTGDINTGTGATNSNSSIFIGYFTCPSAASNTNEIVIGHGATGNGSNSVTLGNNDIIKTILKGNIGIGTESPSTKLHVYSTQSGAFRLEDGTQGPGKILISNANGVASWTSSVSVSIFYNLGGTVSATNSTSAIYRTGSLNIGTGSVSTYTYGPLSVPVDGRFTVSSSTGTVSLVVDESGNIFNDSINGNTKFGFQALNSATSSLIPFGGQGCVAIGARALYSCTSGILNTAVGYGALYYNTASGNVSVGALSLHNNTTGYNNVAVGNNALIFNTTGYLNTAIGNYALGKNTTGYYNISLGVQSGTIISGTGDINTGTGATNSNSSIFIGYFTCPSAASNTNEIVIGHGATGNGSNTVTLGNNFVTRTYLKGSVVIADGTQGNGYILTSDANGVATWIASIYATDSNVVHKTGNESISGIKTFTNTGVLTNVVVQNYNTNPSSSALLVEIGNPGMGIKSENLSSGIGIYSNSTSTGLNYVGANNGVTTFSVDKTGAVSIGTGTASNSRFVVSSSGGTTSFYVNEAGDSVFRGDTKIIGATISGSSTLPPGSITFGSKTAIYPPGDNEIVIGTDTLFRYGWKFTGYQITNLWGNTIEFQNIMGTIGNLFVGSTYQFAGYNVFSPSQRSTLFVKGTTASIMRVVGIGATWSNSQSIFEINNNGAVSIGTSQSMSGTELFIQSNTASTTIGSNVMLDLYNGQYTGTPGQVSELAFSADTTGGVNAYNTQHRYAVISGYAVNWNNVTTGGGIKFSTRATTGSSLVTSLVVDQNGSVYNESRGSSNTIYGYQALLNGTASLNNTAIGYQALLTTTASLYNTAIGYQSLYSNTTGEANTAIGFQSLKLNTTGESNTAIGWNSLLSNTIGSYNTAIGLQSLVYNTAAVANTAIGYGSLFSNTTVVSTINITNGGSGYTMSSTFSNVQLSYISGSTATTYPIVTVYVGTGGTVSTVTLVTNGSGFKDTTTVMGANLGTGVTFSVSVSSLNSGDYNTAVGYRSLYSNTIGDNNVALGYQALYSNTTGIRNTALGHQALYSNTTGVFNIAIGNGSLQNNISGIGNISLGEQTLFNNNANYNIALGAYAMSSNISGTSNIAIGPAALATATQSSGNIAIGYDALYLSTANDANTAIGNYSLAATTTGGNNTAIGYAALASNTTGANNTAIGHQAIQFIIGGNNTALGYYAGTLVSGTTSGTTNSSNSVFIGYDTRPQANGQTNQIVVGYGATGNGSNSVTLGNNDITRTYLKGSVVIADGTQGNGYILTSDTNGVASWTASFALGVIATSSNITTDTLDINGLSQRGRCVIIDNGTYSINLTVNGATGFSSTYLKHGTASVTFVQGSGRTLVQVDGTAVLNGVAGSTATLLSYGTTDYLRINNA